MRVFDLWGGWSYDGIEAWRAMATEWFGSIGTEEVAVEFEDVQSIVGDRVAVASAFVTFKGLAADGTELRSMHNRLTWALAATAEGKWNVVHEHTSAPADFDTRKVELQRRISR